MAMPALLTRISMRPNCSTVRSIMERHDASLPTSSSNAAAFASWATSALMASRFLSARRPAITIAAPAAASPCAIPNPMPALPPVMAATRPARSKSFIARLPPSLSSDAREVLATANAERAALHPKAARALLGQIALIGPAVVGIIELSGPFARSARPHIDQDFHTHQRTVALGRIGILLVGRGAAGCGILRGHDTREKSAQRRATWRNAWCRRPMPARAQLDRPKPLQYWCRQLVRQGPAPPAALVAALAISRLGSSSVLSL